MAQRRSFEDRLGIPNFSTVREHPVAYRNHRWGETLELHSIQAQDDRNPLSMSSLRRRPPRTQPQDGERLEHMYDG